jgi:hypothetical protein
MRESAFSSAAAVARVFQGADRVPTGFWITGNSGAAPSDGRALPVLWGRARSAVLSNFFYESFMGITTKGDIRVVSMDE